MTATAEPTQVPIAGELDFNEHGLPTPSGLRNLHIELCRLRGMTADEIIAHWNALAPGDEW